MKLNESIEKNAALSGELSMAMATCKDYLQVQRAAIIGLKGK
jgi:hypothetical protein